MDKPKKPYLPVVAITPEIYKRLKETVSKTGQKMTWIVRKAIEEYLDKTQN